MLCKSGLGQGVVEYWVKMKNSKLQYSNIPMTTGNPSMNNFKFSISSI